MIAIGAAIGVGLLFVDGALRRSGRRFRAHVMPIAVGMYLPFSLAVPILIGGLIGNRFGPKSDEGHSGDRGLLFGSGLVAGEALIGIVLAGFIAAQVPLPVTLVEHWALSLLAFGGLILLLVRSART
jgi:uncharacterized oligopeptide transporter (OPT) family protein